MPRLGFNSASFLVVLFSVQAIVLADPKIEEQLVGPPGKNNAYVISQHGVHVACIGASGSRVVVTFDGVAGPVVDQVLTPGGSAYSPANTVAVSKTGDISTPVLISPEGDHFAYAARMGDDAVVFYDGKEVARGPMNPSVLNFGPLCLSPSGKHLFFILTSTAGEIKKQFIIDGKPMPLAPQENPPTLQFSQDEAHYLYYSLSDDHKQSILVLDGKNAGNAGDKPHFTADNRLLTIAHVNNKAVLLIDGKPSNQGDGVQSIFTAKGSNKIITINSRANPGGALYYLVVDGKPIKESECLNNITRIAFSPDGNRYMARCDGNGQIWMIVDGKKELTYNGIADEFSFSADSTKYAYVASNASTQVIVVDGKELDANGMAGVKPIFSPKGSRLAYITGENRLKMQVTVDGKASAVCSDVASVVFSPDGSRVGYLYNTMTSGTLSIDGTDQAGIIAGPFIFSPDGKHTLFTGQRVSDRQNGLFVDGQLAYKQVGRFTRQLFSPDGTHAYWADVETPAPIQLVVYVDGKLVRKFDANANSVFEAMPQSWEIGADGVLTFLAATPDGMKKLRVTPGDSTVDTMIADAKAAEEKAVADAAQAKADAAAAKAKAAADAQKAKEDAAAARLKAQQDAAAARQKARDDAAAARAARQNSGR